MPQYETVILSCVGYRASWWRTIAFSLLVVLSGGVFQLCVALFPHLRRVLLTECEIPTAQYVHIQLVDGRRKFVPVRVVVASPEWGQLANRVEPGTWQPLHLQTVFLFMRDYYYCDELGIFVACPAMPMHLPNQICKALDYLHLIRQGGDWSRFNAVYAVHRTSLALVYGRNRSLYDIKDLYRPVVQHGLLPIAFIQYLECIYLVTRGRWIFPTIVATFSLAGTFGLVWRIRQQHKIMTGMVNQCGIVPLVQRGWVRALPAWKLVPGDVVVLQRGKAVCDMVLLNGNCLVEESMLSGEAAQVRKSSYVSDPGVQYDPDSYHTCTVYAGTIVQQVWHAEDPEEEVLAMVVRTGLNTCMGNMVRQILSPSFASAEKYPILQDLLKLYVFALLLQLIMTIPYAIRAAHFHESGSDVLNRLLGCVVHAAPLGLPALMIFISSVNMLRLNHKGIIVIFPEALRLISGATVACFDKTGTLTGSQAELHGIIPANGGKFEGLQQSAMRWSNRLRQAAGVCHSITMVHKTVLAREPMERSMFKLVEAQFLDRQTVVLPMRGRSQGRRQSGSLHLLKVFEFNSQTLMSGALVTADNPSDSTGLLFVKGAHTAVKRLLPSSVLPADYDKVVDELSKKSFRLMAMAVGIVPNVHQLDLSRMSQQQVAAHATGFDLLCLIVLTNHVRPDSKDTITQLQDGGGMRTMMITGDYHHTAIAVAKDVGMVRDDSQVLVIDAVKQPQLSSSQPSASAKKPQASTDHPNPADTIPALLQQQGSSAVQLSHSPYTADGRHSSEFQAPSHTRSYGQTSDAGTSRAPARHIAWSQEEPGTPSPSHAGNGQRQRVSIGSSAACQDRPHVEFSSTVDISNQALPRFRSPAGSTAPHAVLQGQVATLTQPAGSTSSHPEVADLRFVAEGDNTEWEAMQALTALAEGRVQCAVTGQAFELLLQLPDQSALDAVMRNVVVFARMKPHQKGQVMNLLNARGLHQMHEGKSKHIQGLQHTVVFCGDGINDLSALSSADVGYAVGATEASVAASAHTTHNSVAGVCDFVKEGKCSHSLSVSMYKYMVGYQGIIAVASSLTFAIDGSFLSRAQLGCFDFIAMTTAIVAVAGIGPMKQLHPIKPEPQICVPFKLVVVAVGFLYGFLAQAAVVAVLVTGNWYLGSNGRADYNPVVSACFLSSINQLIVVSMSLVKDVNPFCKSPLRSKPFVILILAYFTTSVAMTIAPRSARSPNIFHLYAFPKSFRSAQLALLLSSSVGYGVVMGVIKHVIKKRQQQRIFPA